MARDPRHLPGPAWVDAAWADAPVSPLWRRNLRALFDAGRLRETGYLCLVELLGEPAAEWGDIAADGGCSGLVLTMDGLEVVAPRHAHRVPLIARITAADGPDALERARELGAVAVAGADPAVAARLGLPALVVGGGPGAALVEGPGEGPGLTLAAVSGPGAPAAAAANKRAGGGGVRVALEAATPDAARIELLHAVQDTLADGTIVPGPRHSAG